MARKTNPNLTRVSMNIPSELNDKVKEYAEKNGLNTTSAFIVLLNKAFDDNDNLELLPHMSFMLQQISQMLYTEIFEDGEEVEK